MARSPGLSSVSIGVMYVYVVYLCVCVCGCLNTESCLKRVRVAYGVCVRTGSGAYGAGCR